MAEPVPIRPNQPISVGSDAMRFLADAVAEFITDNGDDPSGAVVVLFNPQRQPTVSFTGVCAKDLCWVGAWMQMHSLKEAGCD
jgi:hypothetical protein